MKRLSMLVMLFMLALPSACVPQPDGEDMPEIGIPVESLNSQVNAFAPKGWNTFKVGDPITLEIYVIGNEEIIFPPDFGIRTFLYRDGNWTEVVESVPVAYSHGDVILSPYRGNLFVSGTAVAFPILQNANDLMLLRIFVSGHIYRNGKATDEKVGAYVDVILHP